MGRVKSALLIDFDNIFGALEKAQPEAGKRFVSEINTWMQWLNDGAFADKQRQRKFIARRVYWNTPFQRFRTEFEAAGFEAFTCAPIVRSKREAGKSTADIVLTMDAMELARELKGLEEVILMTSDSDFVPVVNRLKLQGLRVVSAGNEHNPTYGLYTEHADAVIHVGAFMSAMDYQRAPRLWYKLRSPPPVIPDVLREEGRNSPLIDRMQSGLKSIKQAAELAKIEAEQASEPNASGHNFTPEDIARQRQALKAVENLGRDIPDQTIGRLRIMAMLEKVEGFSKNSRRHAFFGCGTYKRLMLRLAELSPRLHVSEQKNQGVRVVYRVPTEAAPEAASATP